MGYKVVYDKRNCTNAHRCIGIHPEHWSADAEGKAELEGGRADAQSGKYELEIQEKDLPAYREAALICPSYVIDIVDGSGKSILNIKPTKAPEKEKVPVLRAHYDSRAEWKMDPKGFFTIMPFPDEQLIRIRYYGEDHALKLVIEGATAEEIYNTVVRESLVSTFQHAAYVGCELMKAEIAMKKRLPYNQDDPLP